MNSGVYCLTNSTTGDKYIGAASNLRTRELLHFSQLRRGKHSNTRLQTSFSTGAAFTFDILETCAYTDLPDKEREWIDRVRPAFNEGTENRGRPPGGGYVGLPIRSSGSPDLLARVKAWQKKNSVVNFSEAIRQLIDGKLKDEGFK